MSAYVAGTRAFFGPRAATRDMVLGDALQLPFPARAFDAVFAAGLLPHLPDPASGLIELARIIRPGGLLSLFHPIGRAALATIRIDDDVDRYLAIAQRSNDR